jgi:hypothetical protein
MVSRIGVSPNVVSLPPPSLSSHSKSKSWRGMPSQVWPFVMALDVRIHVDPGLLLLRDLGESPCLIYAHQHTQQQTSTSKIDGLPITIR